MRRYQHKTSHWQITGVIGNEIYITDSIWWSTGWTIALTSQYLITPMICPTSSGKMMKNLLAVTDCDIGRWVNVGHGLYFHIEANRSRIVTWVGRSSTQLRRAGDLPVHHHGSTAGRPVKNAAGRRTYCPYQASRAAVWDGISVRKIRIIYGTYCRLSKSFNGARWRALGVQDIA